MWLGSRIAKDCNIMPQIFCWTVDDVELYLLTRVIYYGDKRFEWMSESVCGVGGVFMWFFFCLLSSVFGLRSSVFFCTWLHIQWHFLKLTKIYKFLTYEEYISIFVCFSFIMLHSCTIITKNNIRLIAPVNDYIIFSPSLSHSRLNNHESPLWSWKGKGTSSKSHWLHRQCW